MTDRIERVFGLSGDGYGYPVKIVRRPPRYPATGPASGAARDQQAGERAGVPPPARVRDPALSTKGEPMKFYVVAVRDHEDEIVSGPYETRAQAWLALEQTDRPDDGYLAIREWVE